MKERQIRPYVGIILEALCHSTPELGHRIAQAACVAVQSLEGLCYCGGGIEFGERMLKEYVSQ
jgi:hypothetical protein